MDVSDMKTISTDSSDVEGDSFEDATDTATNRPSNHMRTRSNASVRSLTDRSSSIASARSLTDGGDSSAKMTTHRPSITAAVRHTSPSMSDEATPRLGSTRSAMQDDHDPIKTDKSLDDPNSGSVILEEPSKSPLLTARRVPTFDDVQLQEGGELNESRGRSPVLHSSEHSERSHTRSTSRNDMNYRTLSHTQNMLPASVSAVTPKQQVPSSVTRKFSSPFSWLSRAKSSTQQRGTSPPQPAARRHTAAALGPSGTNSELLLSRLEEEKSVDGSLGVTRLPARESLRERFKLLRLNAAGIDFPTSPEQVSPGDVGLGIKNARHGVGEEEIRISVNPLAYDAEVTNGYKSSRTNSLASNLDPNLAPGTVSWLSCGPSAMQDPESPVDWDLWQAVVYEGPAAVAKTSAAELNRAIASGIPSAIRGVVWQVLAQSKNEELEGVYRELVNRGTDRELPRESPNLSSAPNSANSLNSNGTHKDSLASSSSSIHSDNSTPATTNGMTSPSVSHDIDAVKLQAAMSIERQRKSKDEIATLRKLEKTIRKDLGARTNYSRYAAAEGLQDALFGVCKAYALFDESVGYAQGINFIAMPLLFNMPEEEAFCLLVRLMNQFHLRDMFIHNTPGLLLHLYQFERLLEDVEPALCYHLHKRGITPRLYATQWFLTLFAYRFPLQLVLRIFDLVLSEGLEIAILKFGIALMQKNADTLLSMVDMSALKIFLNERLFNAYIDQTPSANSILESGFFGNSGGTDKEIYRADRLVQDACAVKISPELIKAYTADYEARIRLEKEREGEIVSRDAEIETLKSANASLALKIRSLEERAEKSDTDHVQMATEMIRSKMVNEELRAANKDSQNEIGELKKTIASQPAEVETRLKDEMDRIMSRNIEVQNENRSLEEQLLDMEKDLVTAKMQFAEINSDYEGLKQKWTDLRKALGD